jgi:hypothetical protein
MLPLLSPSPPPLASPLPLLSPPPTPAPLSPACSGVEELERDICFILGLLAIKVEHQAAICEAGALPTLVSMIRRYAGKNDVHLSGVPAQTCRRTSDAITNLAHENNSIKNKVRQEGGIPPLVTLLHSVDPKVQRAVAGSLRTLAFKNDENKNIIVDLGSLPLLIQMLRAEDTTIHYEVRSLRGWLPACLGVGGWWVEVWVRGCQPGMCGAAGLQGCRKQLRPCCRWLRFTPVPPNLPPATPDPRRHACSPASSPPPPCRRLWA